jgi:thiamine-monophosphate kinase
MPLDRQGDTGEDRLIARYFAPIARHPGAFDLTDDAAVLTPPAGTDLVLTTDAIVAGVHFFADDPAAAVAQKALRVNLSDLAAKGAEPEGFLLTLALPDGVTEAWLAAFAQGLGTDADAYGCPLLGGDTVRTPGPVSIAITAFGLVPHGAMVRREGAKAGDRLFVTGTIGDAALGLRLRGDLDVAGCWSLDRAACNHLLWRYRLPQPRGALAAALRGHASAAMDVSDGLAGDLAKLCRVSGVTAEIEIAKVPLSVPAQAALAAEPRLIEPILSGGDDYEVVAAVPADKAASFRHAATAAGVPVSEIGAVTAGEAAPRFLDRAGREITLGRLSFSHF